MKTFREYIEDAERKVGGTKQLAEIIGQKPTAVSDAKAGRRGLPNYALKRLQIVLGLEHLDEIIEAMEWATEKDESKRQFFNPFARPVAALRIAETVRKLAVNTGSKIAGLAVTGALAFASFAPMDADANDTLFVSPSQTTIAAQGSTGHQVSGIQIMRLNGFDEFESRGHDRHPYAPHFRDRLAFPT